MRIKKELMAWSFAMPALLLLIFFTFIPMVIAFIISFTDMNLRGLADFSKISFIGTANYIKSFQDPRFLKAVMNTFYYVIVGVPFAITLALLVALGIHRLTDKISGLFRSVYYAPAVTNTIAVVIVWTLLYNRQFGPINQVLGWFGIQGIDWLGNPQVSKISLIILAAWKGLGGNMIIFLAALKSVPSDYYEAASLDGASSIQMFFKITLPSIWHAFFFVSMTMIIGWTQFFEEPFVMTEGGPVDSTLSVSLYMYQTGFKFNEFGYAAATSFILFAFILGITIVQYVVKERGER